MSGKLYCITCQLGSKKFYRTNSGKWTENIVRATVYHYPPSLEGMGLGTTNQIEEYIEP